MKLPRIYDYFKQGTVLTIDEAREKLQTSGNTLRKRLSELASRGYLHPIRQGLYRVASPGEIHSDQSSSPFHIASKVTPLGYLAFQTALEFHAGEIPPKGETIFIVSSTKFNSFRFEDYQYFWCQSPDSDGLDGVELMDNDIKFNITVTNFEKTIVDCIKRMAHAPRLDRFIYLCKRSQSSPDLELILRYASECGVAAVFNRLGFFFEIMNSFWHTPEQFFQTVESRMSRKHTDWGFATSTYASNEGNINQSTRWQDYGVSKETRNRWKVSCESGTDSMKQRPLFSRDGVNTDPHQRT